MADQVTILNAICTSIMKAKGRNPLFMEVLKYTSDVILYTNTEQDPNHIRLHVFGEHLFQSMSHIPDVDTYKKHPYASDHNVKSIVSAKELCAMLEIPESRITLCGMNIMLCEDELVTASLYGYHEYHV